MDASDPTRGIRLVVGLGNPGEQYARTRHNAGYAFVDSLPGVEGRSWRLERTLNAQVLKLDVGGQSVLLAKPTTFMNHSGLAVSALLSYFKVPPQQLLVAHDDLDLPCGTARLKFDGGHGGQNGLRDIIAQLGHGRFVRMRIGIGHPGAREKVTPWVLGRANTEDAAKIQDATANAVRVFPGLVAGELEKATQQLNSIV